jgi:putative endonuclease
VIYIEKFETRIEAVSRERYLKSGSGREFLKSMLKNAPVVQLDRISDFGSEG